ncbi:MAG: SDR family oxidoreductase, partial [Candidatus Magasanikbacteria bacterium]|nr:SDR family oxidoreductase [Candidatus Magasanikbacteria bacterium]
TDKKQFCAVASVKSNIGHLDEAAGIFGLIKTVLSLQKKCLPASLNFHEPNHKIDWVETPLFVNDKLSKWEAPKKFPRRAGVSSFGLSGTNCHVVLEEFESVEEKLKDKNTEEWKIFTLTAKSREQLHDLISRYLDFFSVEKNLNLSDVCFTLNSGRGLYSHRLAFVFKTYDELLVILKRSVEVIEKNVKIKGIFYRADKLSIKNIQEQKYNNFINWKQTKEESFLKQVAKDYVEGEKINWPEFYQDEKRQRLSLPTYPFEKKRCWFKLPAEAIREPQFELGWRAQEVIIEPIEASEILVFKGVSKKANQICEALAKEVGRENIIEVSLGEKFKKLGKNKYLIGNNLLDYQRLMLELKNQKLYQIVHLLSLEDKIRNVTNFSELEDSQEQGVMSLFYLAKALRTECVDKILNVVVVSQLANQVTGKEKIFKPENSSLLGLSRALVVEFPNWRCRAIDIDQDTNLSNLIREIRSEYQNHKVAFRDNVRYIEELRHFEVEEKKPIKLRRGGVYLFTGGTSGIVLELLKYLSQREKIKIVLLNRSGFPSVGEWKRILADKTSPENLRLLVDGFTEIIKNGSSLYFYQADVSVVSELELALAKIKKELGAINGVVHAAGVAKEKEFNLKTEEDFRKVLGIKIQGTWLLDKLTRDQSLDFFSLFSSAITCFSGAHNGDYIAANSYLDSYAFWGRRQGINFTSVNWPFWNKIGMHVRQVISSQRVSQKNISARQGTEIWFQSLNRERPGLVVVGELNHEGRSAYLIKNSPFTFSPKIISQIEEKIGIFPHAPELDQVELRGSEKSDYSQIEKDIAQILYDVLGYKEIDVKDNFFDLGGDSLFLAEIFYRLEKKYPGMLSITQLFAYPTVAKLAEYLSRSHGTSVTTKIETMSVLKSRDIAVIGLAAKTSLADNVDQLWKNLLAGRECIRPIPKERKADIDIHLRAAGAEEKYLVYSPLAYLSRIDQFDYEYFKFSPREAKLMDPNHRLFLETVITAMEEAGYGGEKLRGSNTGLYLGYGPSDFEYKSFISDSKFAASTALFTGNLSALIPSRVAYLLDLRGPSMVVDTACSSSLVAVHLACQALLSGDCELAVAGGVRLNLVPLLNRFKIGIESSDWHTRTFDDTSDGTGMGEGVAALILKPLDKAIADG